MEKSALMRGLPQISFTKVTIEIREIKLPKLREESTLDEVKDSKMFSQKT